MEVAQLTTSELAMNTKEPGSFFVVYLMKELISQLCTRKPPRSGVEDDGAPEKRHGVTRALIALKQ